MFEEELPDSDSSDEDFVPSGAAGSDVSEEESDDAIDEDADEGQNDTSSAKRKKTKSKSARKKKKLKEEEAPSEPEEVKTPDENPEEKKKHADALWADFLKDCGPAVKKKTEASPLLNVQSPCKSHFNQSTNESNDVASSNQIKNNLKSDLSNGFSKSKTTCDNKTSRSEQQGSSEKIVEVYEFAGEKVIVEKKFDPRKRVSRGGGAGAAAILSQLNKKSKLSTLEKTKLDWDTFKEKEGITEQLTAHNKGKNGYLEKQDFLERADLRQFEIEKEMRAYNRTKRT